MNRTTLPAPISQAASEIPPTSSAVHAASAPNFVVSPPAMAPNEAPTRIEIAEVTVTAVWRELQNNQKTNPENKHAYRPASGGRFASEASPNPAGSRYAASVIPAMTSPL